MTTIDRRTTRRFPLSALLIAKPTVTTAYLVGCVATLLARGRQGEARCEAVQLTYASYHPSAWGL